jgi:tetratricopeptide (TPR) repeat protein
MLPRGPWVQRTNPPLAERETFIVAKRKGKQHGSAVASPAALAPRVERAHQEGRYQQALELGKQLYKLDSTASHRELLQRIYLARAEQLRNQGNLNDVRTMLVSAVDLPGADAAWLAEVAEMLARCGGIRLALTLGLRVADSELQGRIMAYAADWALQSGKAIHEELPEALHGQLDLVKKAFQQVEVGQDDAARETLQGIGLQSPFLEWRVLLRGFMAYYQRDDVRALENWQRLNPDRLPARLAAPFRFQIDAAYQRAQPPEAQAALRKLADRLQGDGLVAPLRVLQAILANQNELPSAFRSVENLLPALKQQAAHSVPRIASCFYWTIVNNGEFEDLARYLRVFGAPADDPGLDRLWALFHENRGDLAKAHVAWQKFADSVAQNPAAWPAEQATRVGALVWQHMGNNAGTVPDVAHPDDLPAFLRDHPERPRPLSPSAEHCYERSLQLAPDLVGTHEARFTFHLHRKQLVEAEAAGRRLLELFPDHVATLEALSGLLLQRGQCAEGLQLILRALRIQPLDRRLRSKTSMAHLLNARVFAEADRFDEARAEYQAALGHEDGKDQAKVFCKWAACEFRAGNAQRAEELVLQAQTQSGSELAVAYYIVIESVRLGLASKLKTRFTKAFNAGFKQPPAGVTTEALAKIAAAHHAAGLSYHGQKAHEKKILQYVESSLKANLTEDQLRSICRSLLDLRAFRLFAKFTTRGKKEFPLNPFFPFFEAESFFEHYGPFDMPRWQVQPLLEKAHKLAGQLPPDTRQQELLKEIEDRQSMLAASSMLSSPFSMLGDMFDEDMEDEDMEDDEFDDDYAPY